MGAFGSRISGSQGLLAGGGAGLEDRGRVGRGSVIPLVVAGILGISWVRLLAQQKLQCGRKPGAAGLHMLRCCDQSDTHARLAVQDVDPAADDGETPTFLERHRALSGRLTVWALEM